MNMKTTHYCKPNLLVLLTFFVGAGVLATSVAQAADASNNISTEKRVAKHSGAGQWLRNWKPEIALDDDGQGLNLARPFGVRGPTLRISNALPDNVKRSLRAGGDRRIGALGSDNPDAYMFLEKRW